MLRNAFILILLGWVTLSSIYAQDNKNYQYALIEAVKQKNLGNLPGAIELYKMVIKENSSVAVAYYELGTLQALTGNGDEALKNLEKAFSMDPDNKWYFGSYIEVLLSRGEIKQAEKLLKEKLKSDPGNAELLYSIGNVQYLGGKERKAIRTLEKIENERGYSDRITLLKANIFENQEKFKRALEEVEKVLELFPESVQFRVVAAELALKSKQEEKAAGYYANVFELDSSNIFAITNLTDYYRNEGNIEKSLFYLNKSFESPEIEYEKKMAILSFYLSDEEFFRTYNEELEVLILTMLDAYPDRREIHLFGTDFFIQKRDYHKALDALEPLLVPEEKQYELWQQGILLANAIENTEKMQQLAEKAYSVFPDSMEIIYFKGIAEYELEQYEKVIQTYASENIEKAENQQMRSQARSLLAEAYYHLGEYTVSDSLFRIIVSEEPDNHLAMNNFSYYLSLRGEFLEEAEKLSRITIDAQPENGTFLDTYAWILFKMGKYDEAENYILKALEFGGENDPDVNEHAAEIHLALGNLKLAKAYFEKALLLGGDRQRLEEKLKLLTNNE